MLGRNKLQLLVFPFCTQKPVRSCVRCKSKMARKTEIKINEIDLIIVGTAGNGKSSTGNSILGEIKFVSSGSVNCCTMVSARETVIRENTKITLADTPGFENLNTEMEIENIRKQLPLAMSFFRYGVHAMLFVVKYGKRFTKEEVNTVEALKKCFGKDFLKDHVIIVVTGGDNFELDHKDGKVTFDSWWEEQGSEFKILIEECGKRIVLFYNNGQNFQEKREQAVAELLDKTKQLIANNKKRRYRNSDFKKCFLEREKLLLTLKLPQLRQQFQGKINKLDEKLKNCLKEDKMSRKDKKILKRICTQLLKEIKKESIGTNSFTDFEIIVKELENEIDKIDKNKPIKDQLSVSFSIMEKLRNPPMSLVVALGIITAVSLASGVAAIVLTFAAPVAVAGAVGVAAAEAVAAVSGVEIAALTAVSTAGGVVVSTVAAASKYSQTIKSDTDVNDSKADDVLIDLAKGEGDQQDKSRNCNIL